MQPLAERRRRRRRNLTIAGVASGGVLVLAVIGVALVVTGREEPTESFSSQTDPSAEMEEYWQAEGPILRDFSSTAQDLAQVDANSGATECPRLASAFDAIGTLQAMHDRASSAPDDIYAEALLEQQAAVSSAFAACRGDAPVTFAEALEELRLSNEALVGLLAEGGLL